MTRPQHIVGWTAGALAWMTAGAGLLACPICFQIDPGPVTDGVRAAVLVLVGVTVTVVGGCAWFMARVMRVGGRVCFPQIRPQGGQGSVGHLTLERPVPQTAESVENRPVPL
jgi:hypothetical protein